MKTINLSFVKACTFVFGISIIFAQFFATAGQMEAESISFAKQKDDTHLIAIKLKEEKNYAAQFGDEFPATIKGAKKDSTEGDISVATTAFDKIVFTNFKVEKDKPLSECAAIKPIKDVILAEQAENYTIRGASVYTRNFFTVVTSMTAGIMALLNLNKPAIARALGTPQSVLYLKILAGLVAVLPFLNTISELAFPMIAIKKPLLEEIETVKKDADEKKKKSK